MPKPIQTDSGTGNVQTAPRTPTLKRDLVAQQHATDAGTGNARAASQAAAVATNAPTLKRDIVAQQQAQKQIEQAAAPTIVKPAEQRRQQVNQAIQNSFATPSTGTTPRAPSAEQLDRVHSSYAGQTVSDLYGGLSSRVGSDSPIHSRSQILGDAMTQLNQMEQTQIKPLYAAYEEAQKNYADGTGSYDDVVRARNEYRAAYDRYQPLYEAWNTLWNADNTSFWNSAELEEAGQALGYLDDVLVAGRENLSSMEQRLSEAETAYSQAAQAFLTDQSESTQAELNRAWSEYNRLQGDYAAQALYYNEMAGIYGNAEETYQRRYLEAHPQIVWARNIGAGYDAEGQLTSVQDSFRDIYDRTENLRQQAAQTTDSAERQKINDEIAYYYAVLNSGLTYATMTQDELNEARDFYQSKLDEAEANELLTQEGHDQFYALRALMNDGRELNAEQQAFYDAYQAAEQEVALAKYWLQQIDTKEDQITHDPVISGFSESNQQLIEDYIYARANDLRYDVDNDRYDVGDLSGRVQQALKDEGLSDLERDYLLGYIRRESDRLKAENLRAEFANAAAETGSLANWLTQFMFSLGSGAGAIDMLGQYALSGMKAEGGVDPWLGKAAPINYNSKANEAQIISQAIGEGEFQHLLKYWTEANGNNEEAGRKDAQLAYNVYNLFQSMGQSAVVAGLTAMGVPGAMLILSSSAATATIQEMHQQGYSDSAAIVAGLVAGFAEHVTEQVSIESLLSGIERAGVAGLTGRELAETLGLNLLKQTVSEGSEEGASDLINLLYDQTMSALLNGGLTQIELAAVQAQQADPGLSWTDAVGQAWNDWAKELGQDMLAGAASGLLMGAGGFVLGDIKGAAEARELGKEVIASGNQTAVQEALSALDSRVAQAVGADTSRGVGGAVATGRALNQLSEATVLGAIDDRLAELGETEASPELLRAIKAEATGQHLTFKERAAIRQSTHGQQVANELASYAASMESGQTEAEHWASTTGWMGQMIQDTFTSAEAGQNFLSERANENQLRYEEAAKAFPEANMMRPFAEQLQESGMSGNDAIKQGALLEKVFSGTRLTDTEMRALDLNIPAVRLAFVTRSGLTGIPKGNISYQLKATYAHQVADESKRIQEMQAELQKGNQQLAEAQKQKSAERAAQMAEASKNAPKNPMEKHIKGRGARAKNAANRAEKGLNRFEQKKTEAQRHKAIPTEGRSAAEIIADVRKSAGNMSLLGYGAFRQQMELSGMGVASTQGVDSAYRMYLQEAGLTPAEITAMETAAQISKGGTSNDLRRGSGQRKLSSDGRQGAERVRSSEKRKAETRTSFQLGIPGGADEGGLRELTSQEIKESAPVALARTLLIKNGIQPQNIHFVYGNGNFIRMNVSDENGKVIDTIDVRGCQDPVTQSVWILVDDLSDAHLTPVQIAAHELFHHWVTTVPSLFSSVKSKMQELGVLEEAERIAREKYASDSQAYGDNLDRYLEEVMADANANVNSIEGANAKQFHDLVVQAVERALISSPADILAAYPSIRTDVSYSAIEIPKDHQNSHYDNLGRKLSKQMDEYMAGSYMRTDSELDKPLTVMYRGGGMRREEMGRRGIGDSKSWVVFWTDRAEIARTYSQGKMESEISHGQEHTKARQQIQELESRLLLMDAYGTGTEEEMKQIMQELRDLHDEIEPFSKDIYAPSADRNVWPERPFTFEEAKALIDRFGAYNRTAKLVELSPEKIISDFAGPMLEKARKAVTKAQDILYALSDELSGNDEVEDELGPPPWMEDDEFNDYDTAKSEEFSELIDIADNLNDDISMVMEQPEFTASQKKLPEMYRAFEIFDDIDYSTLDGMLKIARGDMDAFFPSKELRALVREYDKLNFDLRDARRMADIVFSAINSNSSTYYGLDVKGLGLQKFFLNEEQVIDFGDTLIDAIGENAIYSCYLDITKPLIIDAHGLSYSDLGGLTQEEFPEQDAIAEWKKDQGLAFYLGTHIRSRDVANWASKQYNEDGTPKYDGVIIRNVVDTLADDGAATVVGDKRSTVAITWDPNVPKSTANARPTPDPRISYSAVVDSQKDIEKAREEIKPSKYRSDELNKALPKLLDGRHMSKEELLKVPEIAKAEKAAAQEGRVEWNPVWDNEVPIAVENFSGLGSYDSDSDGATPWHGPVENGRKAFLVIGPPGAGKSTVAVNRLSEANHARVIDKDMYRRAFTGNKNGENASLVDKPAGRVRQTLYEQAIEKGENFVWPLIGLGYKANGADWEGLYDSATRLRDAGYQVYVVYVGLQSDVAIGRSMQRAFPSDGSTGRYTNLAYLYEAVGKPAENYQQILQEMYNGAPLIAGSAWYDNSRFGEPAILMGKSTVPGLKESKNKWGDTKFRGGDRIYLPSKEYGRVMHEIGSHYYGPNENDALRIISLPSAKSIYLYLNNGFGNYTVIAKAPISQAITIQSIKESLDNESYLRTQHAERTDAADETVLQSGRTQSRAANQPRSDSYGAEHDRRNTVSGLSDEDRGGLRGDIRGSTVGRSNETLEGSLRNPRARGTDRRSRSNVRGNESGRLLGTDERGLGLNGKAAVRQAENRAKAAENRAAEAAAKLKAAETEKKAQNELRKAQKRERTQRINDALARNKSSVRVGQNSDLSGAIDYAMKEKLRALEHAKIDAQWQVGMAKSEGEQEVNRLQRFWKDKFNYATKTDKQWARGLYQSGVRETKAEQKRRTKEAVSIDRKLHSLPATAAVSSRRKFQKADQITINDNQAVATLLPFKDEASKNLPKTADEFRKAFMQGYDATYRAMVNAEQELDRMAKLQTRTDNLSVWVNVVRASKHTTEQFFEYGLLDKKGDLMGPSMKDTFLCYDADGKFDQKLQNALNDYMFYKHTVDRMSLKKRAMDRVHAYEQKYPWLVTLEGKEFAQLVAENNPIAVEYARLMKTANETEDKPVLADADGKPVTAESAQKVVDTYESEMPWLVEKANSIYEWWDVFMREWAVGTSISEAQYEQMHEMYPHYVPTYRKNKGSHAGYTAGTKTGLSSGEVVKKAKGSTAELESMEDQYVRSLSQIVRNNRQNDLLRNIVEEFLFDDEGVFANYGFFDWANSGAALKQDLWDFAEETEATSVEKVKINGEQAYHISCWVDGVKMSAYVNRAMFEGLNFLFDRTSDAYKKAVKIGNWLSGPMKSMITGLNTTFALKNVIRDQHTAFTNSQSGFAYGKYLGQAAAKIAANDDDWVNFQALGGVSSTQHRMEGGFTKAMLDKGGGWRKAAKILGKPGEVSESVSRFAEYLATIDRLGGDTYENRLAAIRDSAEVTVDFGRRGTWGTVINAWVPYWNPAVQGLDKAIRNVAQQPDFRSAAKRLWRAGVVNAIVVAIQALALTAGDAWDEYKELSDQVKDNYYCFPLPGNEHKFIKIPKSQDWAAFISTPIIRTIEGAMGRDDPMEGWFESAVVPMLPFEMRDPFGLGVNMPTIMPIFLDTALDLKENKNYAGGAIIPYNLQDVSAKEQYDADTSVIARLIGEAFGASPMAVDYVIGNYMGNFFGTIFRAFPLSPLNPIGYYTGETKLSDKALDALQTILSPFVADNRYSNSTMASYYETLNQLEQEVTDAGRHGDEKDAEHYEIYKALTQSGGYVDQIRALTSQARELTRGREQADIRLEAAGLADLALQFIQDCVDGKIKDPRLWMTYQGYGETIMHEAEALNKYADEFNFNGQLGRIEIFYDRTGEIDYRYELTDEQQADYASMRTEEYRKALETVINSSAYKNASDTEKAAMLEAAKSRGLKRAEALMIEYLRDNKVNGQAVTKVNYSEEERAAAYSVSWLLGESRAYDPTITNELVTLYDYHDQYSFMPSESTKKTFRDQDDNTLVYELNSDQQTKYADLYYAAVTENMHKVIQSAEYQAASSELRAAMLARARQYASNDVVEAFNDWLHETGAVAVEREQASEVISLEAKYAVQRALGDDLMLRQEVSDELIRLYQYADVGEVEYFPIDRAPTSYVDETDKRYMWELNEYQRDVYMGMMLDIYQQNILKVMRSSAYQTADDYGKAQLLCDVRSRLAAQTQAEFKKWLRDTGAERTQRTSDAQAAIDEDIEAAGEIVDSILGEARTYKEFKRLLG